jgi:tetratricopeptide (TPR) repeat protein
MIRTARMPRLPRPRRLPGGRYLVLPAVALAVVIGAQAWNITHPAVAPVGPAVVSVAQPGDLTLPGDGGAIGGVDTSDVDRRIAFWRERIRTQGDTETSYQILGDLLALKGRLTGDLSNYSSAEEAYRTALKLAPRDVPSMVGLARILATLHQFPEAIDQALASLQLDRRATGAIGVIFDASVEIGRLDDADAALKLLQERGGQTAAIGVRAARLAFIRGDVGTAITLTQQARTDAETDGAQGEELAFYDYALGEYRFLAGDAAGATRAYGAAATALPGYVLAQYGQARSAYALGDTPSAIGHLQKAVASLPRPDMLAYLGDMLALSGDATGAENQYKTVDFIAGLGTAPGQVYNREYALFLAGHGRNTALAVQLASAELASRKDVFGYDAYAWALYADGRAAAALEPMRQALALGTPDARLFEHAGLIEMANGMVSEGRAHLQKALDLGLAYDPLGTARVQKALGR